MAATVSRHSGLQKQREVDKLVPRHRVADHGNVAVLQTAHGLCVVNTSQMALLRLHVVSSPGLGRGHVAVAVVPMPISQRRHASSEATVAHRQAVAMATAVSTQTAMARETVFLAGALHHWWPSSLMCVRQCQ